MLLFAFGFVHSLIYRGDILTIYAVIGLCLPFFYRVPGKVLWFMVVLLLLGAGRYLFYLAIFGRAYLTLAYFLVGMWLVRAGIIGNLEANKPMIRKTLQWSLGLCVVFFILIALSFTFVPDLMDFKNWLSVLAFVFYDLFNTAFTALLMSGFLLLFLRSPAGWTGRLAPFGRMALSNYILQSLIGTFVFYGWGLGLVGQLHDRQTFLLGIVVILFQIRVSRWWLTRYYYGPLGWLWRYGAFFRKVRFARAM